jgi:hypothetical protein
MAARSVQIQLANNTNFPLTLIASHLCHGKWTNGVQPPPTVAAKSQVSWESQSDGVLTGTQGWAKYYLVPSTGGMEQVLVSWDNPYVPASGTPWINGSDSIYNISPPCGNDNTGGFASQGPSTFPDTHQYQIALTGAGNTGTTTNFDMLKTLGTLVLPFTELVALGNIILDIVTGGVEVQLTFSVQVELKGSVGEALPINYDKSKGLRPLANEAKTSSIRKLIGA